MPKAPWRARRRPNDTPGDAHGPVRAAAGDRRLCPHASEGFQVGRGDPGRVCRDAAHARPPLWRECGGAGHHHHDAAGDDDDGSDHHDDAAGDDHDDGTDHHDDAPATTTTTRPRPTTTTSHPTTTTTTAAKTSSSSKVWGWVLLAAAIALAAILVGYLIARNRRQARAVDWRRSVLPAVTAAELARELVVSLTPTDDPQRRADVGVQVDEAVAALERAAASAPDEASRALCSRCCGEPARPRVRGGGRLPLAFRRRASDRGPAGRRRCRPAEPVSRAGRGAAGLEGGDHPHAARGVTRGAQRPVPYSARNMTAVGVRAAVRAGTAATTLASTSVPSATRTIEVTDTVG